MINWLKQPSHGKLKLANSCWQTRVGVCERHKNSRQTRFYLTPTVCKRVCRLFLCRLHTPTWVCPATRVYQLKFAVWRPLYNWVYTTLLLNWFTCRPQTIVKNLSNERASKLRNYTKKDVLKNRFILNCFMLVASNSPVKFSKSVFPIVKFRAKFDWSCTRNTISISRCESLEIRPFYRKLGGRKRGNSLSVFYRISLKYSNYQRG